MFQKKQKLFTKGDKFGCQDSCPVQKCWLFEPGLQKCKWTGVELFSGLDSGVGLKGREEAVFKDDFQVSCCHSLNKWELHKKQTCGERT